MMTFVFIYYNNPQMLRRQIECWNSYKSLPRPPKIILVDDGSRQSPALDVIQSESIQIPFELYRIEQDIPWNFAGARNLGCDRAEDWIHLCDIDTLIYAADALRMIEITEAADLDGATHKCFLPRRVLIPYDQLMRPSVVNLTFHKTLFLKIGGCDEDYAGHYGREHNDFYERLQRTGNLAASDTITVRLMPHWLIGDAKTATGDRNDHRNTELFLAKRKAGFPVPAPGLRFAWTQQA